MKITSVTAWAVGVTTAPRRHTTLAETLRSLAAAGWERPRLFVEPGVEIGTEFAALPATHRDTRLGAFPNWYLALSELFLRAPQADAYFLCQDDVLVAEGLRGYLERTLWPAEPVGVVSLFCPGQQFASGGAGYFAVDWGWEASGALAYVFPNTSLRLLLTDGTVLDHRFSGPARGLRDIDSVVGRWCRQTGLAYYVHLPSLAQHIGTTSTLFPRAACRGVRRAAEFLKRVE